MSVEIKVNASRLECKEEYVCWVDIMGTKSIMTESFQKAANFILRFHACITDVLTQNEGVKCYPLMDGVFLTSPHQEIIEKVIDQIFSDIASIFVSEEKNAHRFVIRGALSYGSIVHGESINKTICRALADGKNYKDMLLMGMAMIQAFNSERIAPPFGVYIHESARKYKGLQGRVYQWNSTDKINRQTLVPEIKSYFKWCEKYHEYLEMDLQKIALYQERVDEYFSDRMEEDSK